MRCPTCELRKGPPRPLPARPGTRPVAFNMEVHIDLKYEKDFKRDAYVGLSMVDSATCFHADKLLRSRNPAHVAGKLFTGWIAMFGVPVTIVSDQGGEFETEFIALLEDLWIPRAWQNGVVERHNGLLGVSWSAVVQSEQVVGRAGMKVALCCALLIVGEDILPISLSSAGKPICRNSWMRRSGCRPPWARP